MDCLPESTLGLTALETRQLAEVRHGLRVLRGDRRLGPTQIPRVVQCASVRKCVGIKTARDALTLQKAAAPPPPLP